LANLVNNKPIKGVLAVKPPNSDPQLTDTAVLNFNRNADSYIYDFVGMTGIPLVPTPRIDTDADAAFFPVQVMKDPDFEDKIRMMLDDNKPVLITDGLASHLNEVEQYENLTVLDINVDPRNILHFSRGDLNRIRNKMLKPLGISFDAPSMVALYLMGENIIVIENFNDTDVMVNLGSESPMEARIELVIPESAIVDTEFSENNLVFKKIPARTLVALSYK
jgi:hypothetical protein